MFVVVVEYALAKAKVIGPFPHQEDADEYAKEYCKGHIWRITELIDPEQYHGN